MKRMTANQIQKAFYRGDRRKKCTFNNKIALEDAVKALRLHVDYLKKTEGLNPNFLTGTIQKKNGKTDFYVGNYFIIFRDVNWNTYTHNFFIAYKEVRKQLTELQKKNKTLANKLINILDSDE